MLVASGLPTTKGSRLNNSTSATVTPTRLGPAHRCAHQCRQHHTWEGPIPNKTGLSGLSGAYLGSYLDGFLRSPGPRAGSPGPFSMFLRTLTVSAEALRGAEIDSEHQSSPEPQSPNSTDHPSSPRSLGSHL